jgi:hypothetical protein
LEYLEMRSNCTLHIEQKDMISQRDIDKAWLVC